MVITDLVEEDVEVLVAGDTGVTFRHLHSRRDVRWTAHVGPDALHADLGARRRSRLANPRRAYARAATVGLITRLRHCAAIAVVSSCDGVGSSAGFDRDPTLDGPLRVELLRPFDPCAMGSGLLSWL